MVPQVNDQLICLGGASTGWTHGVQFVRLVFQNSMACQIDGCTVHHWSGIPVGETDGTALTKDAHKLADEAAEFALCSHRRGQYDFRAARGSPGHPDRQGNLEA